MNCTNPSDDYFVLDALESQGKGKKLLMKKPPFLIFPIEAVIWWKYFEEIVREDLAIREFYGPLWQLLLLNYTYVRDGTIEKNSRRRNLDMRQVSL